jgi:hypothetical protein
VIEAGIQGGLIIAFSKVRAEIKILPRDLL